MKVLKLDNESLWDWMAIGRFQDKKKSMDDYLRLIARNQGNVDYIMKLKKTNSVSGYSKIMENLSHWVPREYFLEIQFCVKTMGLIFGTVFPPFVSHVEELAYIEWLLYTEPGYTKYRDHLTHLFKVAYTGDRILSQTPVLEKIACWQFESEHFKQWCRLRKYMITELEDDEKKDIVKIAFFLAALFHDFGYGYFFHNLYQGRLSKTNHWLQPGSDLTNINAPFFLKLRNSLPYLFVEKNHQWCVKSNSFCKEHQKELLISGFFRDGLPLNHSIASSFTILDIAERLWDVGVLSENLYISFQLAAEAIMIHDMTGGNNWMHLGFEESNHFLNTESCKSFPIAILLIFADELAIWKRFKIKPEHLARSNEIVYKIDREFVPKKIELEFLENEVKISPYYKTVKEVQKDVLENKFNDDLSFFKKEGSPMFLDYKIELNPLCVRKRTSRKRSI